MDSSLVSLRKLAAQDRQLIESWLTDEEILQYDIPAAPPCESRTHRAWAILLCNETVGWVELYDINRRAASAEMRICIGRKDLWGKGVGTQAVKLLLHSAQHQLKLKEVYLRVAPHNRRALRAYQKCGFVKEGLLRVGRRATLGQKDHYLMSARLTPEQRVG